MVNYRTKMIAIQEHIEKFWNKLLLINIIHIIDYRHSNYFLKYYKPLLQDTFKLVNR